MPKLSDIKKQIKELKKKLDEIDTESQEFLDISKEIRGLEKQIDGIHTKAKKALSNTDKIPLDVEVKKSKKNDLLRTLDYLDENFDIKYNLFTELSEIKEKNKTEYTQVNEHLFDKIRADLILKQGLNITKDDLDMVISASHIVEEYNPIEEYIDNLDKWDEKTDCDYIAALLSHIELADESEREYFVFTFKKWMVGLVGGLVDNSVYNHTCFVLVSTAHGIGKSTFFSYLVPEKLRLHYYYVGNYQMEKNKDHEEMIGTKILINLDELATLNKHDVESFKTRVTQPTVTVRRAYGRKSTYLWRRASFCGTINWDIFLTDQSGSRRWIPFIIKNMNMEKIRSFDIDKVYSQAFALFKKGFQFYFDLKEIRDLEKHNDKFKNISMEEELIATHYTIPTEKDISIDTARYASTTDIANELAMRYTKINVNDSYKNKLGRSLKILGFQQIMKRARGSSIPVRVWIIKDIPREGDGKIRYSSDFSEETITDEKNDPGLLF